MVELPVVIGAKPYEIFHRVNHDETLIPGKFSNRADVTGFDM